jgi:hypothetical protein
VLTLTLYAPIDTLTLNHSILFKRERILFRPPVGVLSVFNPTIIMNRKNNNDNKKNPTIISLILKIN